jgi:hypothetical protein
MFGQPFSPECPQPSQIISPGPVVRVTDRHGLPQRGVEVHFETVTGQVERPVVVTDADGTASAGSWTLAESAGLDILIARIPRGPNFTFAVTSRSPAQVIANYDLVTIGGKPLPISFSFTGSVTGGHYVLAGDGTYSFQYEMNGQGAARNAPLCSNARYATGSSTIDFYLAPGSYPLSTFYQERNGHFATATVSGRTMSVKYDDVVDFDDEQYELESGFDPIALGTVSARGQLMAIPGSTTSRPPVEHARSAHRP